MASVKEDLEREIQQIPVVDIHSHLSQDSAVSGDFSKVICNHMIRYLLRATGTPEQGLWKNQDLHVLSEFFSFEQIDTWQLISNTGFAWMLRRILHGLYGFSQDLSRTSWHELREVLNKCRLHPNWMQIVLDKAGVTDILSSNAGDTLKSLIPAYPKIHPTLEVSPISGYDEDQTWQQRLQMLEQISKIKIRSFDDLCAGASKFMSFFDWSDKCAFVIWVSSEADFRPIGDREIKRLLRRVKNGSTVSLEENASLQAAYIKAICRAVENKARVVQLCFGCHLLPSSFPHPVQNASLQFLSTFGYMLNEFSNLHFDVLNAYEPFDPLWCSLCLAYGNMSLSGFWWHMFHPSIMHAAFSRRLDVVPVSRLCGFFSDAHCVDWVYARLELTRKVLTNVLTEKIEQGFYSSGQALSVARSLFFETPRSLFSLKHASE